MTNLQFAPFKTSLEARAKVKRWKMTKVAYATGCYISPNPSHSAITDSASYTHHGSFIARTYFNTGSPDYKVRAILFTLAGWNSATTRERLSRVLRLLPDAGLSVGQRGGVPVLYAGSYGHYLELDPTREYAAMILDRDGYRGVSVAISDMFGRLGKSYFFRIN